MLPAQARLRRRPEFTAVVRSGRRVGRSTMVLHYLPPPARPAPGGTAVSGDADGSHAAGPDAAARPARAGFVVGRAVGNSVVRHRVTRRLRHLVRAELDRLPEGADLVVRARPEAAAAGSAQLGRDLGSGLDRLGLSRSGASPSSGSAR